MRHAPTLLMALFMALASRTSRADAIDLNLVPKVMSGGKDRPAIVLTANEETDEVEVRLKRDDGKTFAWRSGKIREGAERRYHLEVPPGEHRFTGTLTVKLGKSKTTTDLDFVAEIVPIARLAIDQEKVDLAARSLVVTSTRKTAKVEIVVTSDQGRELGRTELAVNPVAEPGTPIPVTWRQSEGTVLKMNLRVHDPDGFFVGLDLFPWRVDIPHEEVNFATGSSRIEPPEEPKLDKSFALITDAVAKVQAFAGIRLYVVGHTDTVAAKDMNLTLSLARARAIAEALRRRGLRIPIYYDGLGEEALLVETADETDEPRNRRAEYIVAIEDPPVHHSKRAASWKLLR